MSSTIGRRRTRQRCLSRRRPTNRRHVLPAENSERLSRPTPGRGSWTRRQFGHQVKQPPLPLLPNGRDPIISFHVQPRETATPPPEQASPEVAAELEPENRIIVPETVERLHRSVRRTQAVLAKAKPDYTGRVSKGAKDCFNITVSPPQLDRVCRILHALVTAIEQRGHRIVEGDDQRSGLRIQVQDELLTLAITERFKRHTLAPGEGESPPEERDQGWAVPGDRTEWRPNGQLTVTLPNSASRLARWGDRKDLPLERRLNEVIAALVEGAAAKKHAREVAARRQLEQQEESRRREEARKKAEIDRARFRRLERLARLWRRRETIDAFLAAVKERMREARPELVPTAQAWIDWAELYLDEHRPVDVLFFQKLLEPDSHGFYGWTGGYGERDEWFEMWPD